MSTLHFKYKDFGGAIHELALPETTAKGDLIVHNGTENIAVAVGSNGHVLTADSAEAAGVKWAAAGGGASSPLTTKGDVWVYSTVDARLPVGTNGQVLSADSAEATGLKWVTPSPGVTDHGALNGLADDDHTQYAILAGRAGGQAVNGGTAASENLTLASTAHATKGTVRTLDRLVTAGGTTVAGVVSPSSFGTDQNDYAPSGLATASVLRLTTSTAVNITGLSSSGVTGTTGALYLIHNIGSNAITLKDEHTSSSAANRFALNGDAVLPGDTAAMLWYDLTSSRWRLLAKAAFNIADVSGLQAALDGKAATVHTHSFADITSGTVSTSQIADDAVTYAKMQNVSATSRLLGRITTGAGNVEELTGTQAVSFLDVFTSSNRGVVPGSGGGTNNFLRADGSWAPMTFGTLSVEPIAANDSIPFEDESDSSAIKKAPLDRIRGLNDRHVCEGRLTTETGVPVSSSDRSLQSTIYFTPYRGSAVALNDGTRWKLYNFTEVSLALSGLTGSKNYDVFLYDNAGTLTLELSAAWTNDTTRADALALQDGVYVKSGSITRRYLGTFRAFDATRTDDTEAKRHVWNYYNRVPRSVRVHDGTNTWTYSTATWRQKNGSTSNQVSVVAGIAESLIDLRNVQQTSTSVNAGVYTAIGRDSTTTPTPTAQTIGVAGIASGLQFQTTAYVEEILPLGYHFYAALERGHGSGTQTWYGDNGDSTITQTALSGVYFC